MSLSLSLSVCVCVSSSFWISILRKYSLTRSAEKNDDNDDAGGEKRVTSLEGWMIYWIVVGFWTCVERVLDVSVFWLPLYNEFKVAFCIYLWHPNTRGAEFLYFSLVKPYLIMNEAVIDAYICDIKAFVYDSILSMLDRSKTVRCHTHTHIHIYMYTSHTHARACVRAHVCSAKLQSVHPP